MFLYAQKIFISFLKMDDKQSTNVFYRGKETTLIYTSKPNAVSPLGCVMIYYKLINILQIV